MDKPKLGPRQIVYQNPFLKISSVQVQSGEFCKTLYVIDSGPRVGVLLLKDDNVLLVRQYRMLINDLALEIPGGKVDEGETTQTAAIRECLEETGLRCLSLQPLLYYHPGLDTNDNPTSIFYCTQSEPVSHHKLDHNEVAELVWIPFSRCLDMVFQKQIVDCLSIAAILAWQARKMRRDV
ncbi:MAG: NUDIX hydrolase [Verrucomicrobiota bacterium]|jgi:8-oxo-dGTP pyrophosphatase MutT (NUDIX family)